MGNTQVSKSQIVWFGPLDQQSQQSAGCCSAPPPNQAEFSSVYVLDPTLISDGEKVMVFPLCTSEPIPRRRSIVPQQDESHVNMESDDNASVLQQPQTEFTELLGRVIHVEHTHDDKKRSNVDRQQLSELNKGLSTWNILTSSQPVQANANYMPSDADTFIIPSQKQPNQTVSSYGLRVSSQHAVSNSQVFDSVWLDGVSIYSSEGVVPYSRYNVIYENTPHVIPPSPMYFPNSLDVKYYQQYSQQQTPHLHTSHPTEPTYTVADSESLHAKYQRRYQDLRCMRPSRFGHVNAHPLFVPIFEQWRWNGDPELHTNVPTQQQQQQPHISSTSNVDSHPCLSSSDKNTQQLQIRAADVLSKRCYILVMPRGITDMSSFLALRQQHFSTRVRQNQQGGQLLPPPFTEAALAVLFLPMVLSIQHMHRLGYVHRDISLSNFVLKAYPQQQDTVDCPRCGLTIVHHVCQCGFALSHPSLTGFDRVSPSTVGKSEDPTYRGIVGTLPYLAPELCDDSVKHKAHLKAADVWALGVCLYKLAFGSYPFSNDAPVDHGYQDSMSPQTETERATSNDDDYAMIEESPSTTTNIPASNSDPTLGLFSPTRAHTPNQPKRAANIESLFSPTGANTHSAHSQSRMTALPEDDNEGIAGLFSPTGAKSHGTMNQPHNTHIQPVHEDTVFGEEAYITPTHKPNRRQRVQRPEMEVIDHDSGSGGLAGLFSPTGAHTHDTPDVTNIVTRSEPISHALPHSSQDDKGVRLNPYSSRNSQTSTDSSGSMLVIPLSDMTLHTDPPALSIKPSAVSPTASSLQMQRYSAVFTFGLDTSPLVEQKTIYQQLLEIQALPHSEDLKDPEDVNSLQGYKFNINYDKIYNSPNSEPAHRTLSLSPRSELQSEDLNSPIATNYGGVNVRTHGGVPLKHGGNQHENIISRRLALQSRGSVSGASLEYEARGAHLKHIDKLGRALSLSTTTKPEFSPKCDMFADEDDKDTDRHVSEEGEKEEDDDVGKSPTSPSDPTNTDTHSHSPSLSDPSSPDSSSPIAHELNSDGEVAADDSTGNGTDVILPNTVQPISEPLTLPIILPPTATMPSVALVSIPPSSEHSDLPVPHTPPHKHRRSPSLESVCANEINTTTSHAQLMDNIKRQPLLIPKLRDYGVSQTVAAGWGDDDGHRGTLRVTHLTVMPTMSSSASTSSLGYSSASTSIGLSDLVSRMLHKDWKQRPSIEDVLAHPWIRLMGQGSHMLYKAYTECMSSLDRMHGLDLNNRHVRSVEVLSSHTNPDVLFLGETSDRGY